MNKIIKLAQQHHSTARTFLPTPLTFIIKLSNVPSTPKHAHIYFKINLFSKTCVAGDASPAPSRQHPQAQWHHAIRAERLLSIVEGEEEGGGQSESLAGSGMNEEVHGHPCCPTPGYLPWFISQSPKASSVTGL